MKRAIIALSILCTGALVINPISFAQNKTNYTHQEISQGNKEEISNVGTNNKLNEEEKLDKTQNTEDENAKEEVKVKEENSTIVNNVNKKEENDNNDKKANTENIDENNETKDEVNNKLTQEQAKELLKSKNPSVDFIYQGDASNFDALKAKGLNGYVFLPNVEGDMGYFVDESTGDIYNFHPSGYLELLK